MSQIKNEFDIDEKNIVEKNNYYLYFVAAAVNIASFSAGIGIGWPSAGLPRLNGMVDPENNPLFNPITPIEESWIGSLSPLAACIGPAMFGYASDKIGRKQSMLLSMAPITLAFIVKIFANQVIYFYLARFLVGLTTGGIYTVIPMFMGEIAEDTNRGALGCFMPVMCGLGILFSYAVGPYISIKWFSTICIFPSILFVVLMLTFVPESPHYLVMKNMEDIAFQSLKKLRTGSKQFISKELIMVKHFVEESFLNKLGLGEAFKENGTRKALKISIVLMVIQQGSGITVILTYLQSIFEASGSNLRSDLATVIIGIVQIVTIMIIPLIIDKLGRRLLLLVSAIGSTISQIILAIYFTMQSYNYDVSCLRWLPIFCLIIYMIAYSLGFGPLPWVILGEIFPPNVKALASILVTICCSLLAFLTAFIFPYVIMYIGLSQSFWLFGLFCLGGGIFIFCFVPETKERSLHEIQIMLNS